MSTSLQQRYVRRREAKRAGNESAHMNVQHRGRGADVLLCSGEEPLLQANWSATRPQPADASTFPGGCDRECRRSLSTRDSAARSNASRLATVSSQPWAEFVYSASTVDGIWVSFVEMSWRSNSSSLHTSHLQTRNCRPIVYFENTRYASATTRASTLVVVALSFIERS
jgi:hypothetical protein